MQVNEEKLLLLRGIRILQGELSKSDPDKDMVKFLDLHRRHANLVNCLVELEFREIGQRGTDHTPQKL